MLAKSIKLSTPLYSILLSLAAFSCAATPANTFLGNKEGKTFLRSFTSSNFCKKYKCRIDYSVEAEDQMGFMVTTPEIKNAFGIIQGGHQESLLLNFSKKTGQIISSEISLGLDYPSNGMKPEYAELANDFSILLTGRSLMSKSEYFSGGDLSLCMDFLDEAQKRDRSTSTKTLIKGTTTAKVPFIISCGQLSADKDKQVNRWLEIKVR